MAGPPEFAAHAAAQLLQRLLRCRQGREAHDAYAARLALELYINSVLVLSKVFDTASAMVALTTDSWHPMSKLKVETIMCIMCQYNRLP